MEVRGGGKAPIYIDKGTWIGLNAVLLPGVILEDHCVVGANAVVTQSFSKGSIIVGIPGKCKKIIGE